MKIAAIEIIKRLRQAGYLAYWVGGCVRDLVMGHPPTDYDIATSATPDAVVQLFPRSLTVGAQFGVVLVPQGDHFYEVATFRSEGTYSDGRRPDQVTYTTDPRQDVERRDFTINGLLYDPLEGTVLDYVGGQSDIHSRLIRTIGNPEQRFLEDKLRLVRAVRFAARFNFRLDNSTREAILELAETIRQVSQERIREELIRVLTHGYAARGISLMDSCGLLRFILPEVTCLHGVAQPPEFHPEGDVWTHTLLMLELMDQRVGEEKTVPEGDFAAPRPAANSAGWEHYPSPTLALGVLLHDIGKPPTFERSDRIRFNNHPEVGARMAASLCERLRFTSKQTLRITELVRDHLKFKDLPQMRASTLKRFLRQEGFEEHLELHRLDCLGSHRHLETWELANQKREEFSPEETRPKPLLSGEDLIRLGYVPGPVFKQILKSVEDAQLDNRVRTQEEAERFVLSQYRQ
jgi:putative nucleotidyltransferase with HDIG domain